MTEETAQLTHLARVHPATLQQRDVILNSLREKGYVDEATITETPPFLFRAEISNNLLDSHYTRMSPNTLRNYARDAEKGVAFLRGHNHHELPIGYSVTGLFEEGDKTRVVADFYTMPGSPDTDDLIFRMKSGLVRDVSVGFHGGDVNCDICGNDFYSADCRHFPGLKYEGREGDATTKVVATMTIDGAGLSEVSGVFDGSTPDATVLKAQRAAKEGTLTREQVTILEQRYRINLPTTRTYAVPTKEKKMEEKDLERVRTTLVSLGVVSEEDARAIDENSLVSTVETLGQTVRNLQPQAADGRQYRKDLVAEALAEGVRAQGNDFDAPTYTTVLENAPISTIKRMKDDWKKIADKVLPGGRQTQDEDERRQEPKTKVSVMPDKAFQG